MLVAKSFRFASHGITERFARISIKCGQQPIAPSPDRIVLKQQRKRAYTSRPLETAEHHIVGVGWRLASEIGLRCEHGANGLKGLPERQNVRLATGGDRLQHRT